MLLVTKPEQKGTFSDIGTVIGIVLLEPADSRKPKEFTIFEGFSCKSFRQQSVERSRNLCNVELTLQAFGVVWR